MTTVIHRIEVRPRTGLPDPRGESAQRDCAATGIEPAPARVEAASVFLIEGALDDAALRRVAGELLADPVTEDPHHGASAPRADAVIEVHPLPGVMDPDAEAVELAIRSLLDVDVTVRTGRRYDLHRTDAATARRLAERCLANPVIHAIHETPYQPTAFARGTPRTLEIRTVELRGLDDDALLELSRQAHLFLSLDEMRAIRDEYARLGRDPREIELETLAQTWSEHCVHKTLKSTVRYAGPLPPAPGGGARPGAETAADGTVTFHNLLKSTIAAATEELIAGGVDWCLSVFVDNAGVIAFDDERAVCFKCETHNHPSAIEPYGGAATGLGGCIRDIMGTGLSAKPIAATDVFCVAHLDHWTLPGQPTDGARPLPAGCLHPQRILRQVVAGVADYGNRMGIPTVNGAVWFDDDHIGNPLVFCGCIGVMPRDLVHGAPRPGDRIIAVGGRTGRDGIHGATFSSAELTDAHADEFGHAVQIGNPVTEKKMLDAILAARDDEAGCLYHAITDCGAGGFSSAVGEMGETLGAEVDLERAPLKYEGLTATEIWISEAQERMVLAVPEANVPRLRAICDRHDVELCDLGRFGTEGRELILRSDGTEVGRLPMAFLHDGLPETVREARWTGPPAPPATTTAAGAPPVAATLRALLAHPNIASKRWIIRQYDHEVQGASVVRPLAGPRQNGPSDAAVILPAPATTRGLAIASGLATGLADDPHRMALAAIDECVRNLVCVGADPDRIAILDNFSWPSCADPDSLGSLVRACVGCYDAAKAYRTPFISGKDSLNNQFSTEDGATIRIPPTLLISGMGIVDDVRRCVTMDAKTPGSRLVVVGTTTAATGGSHARLVGAATGDDALPAVDLDESPAAARAVHALVRAGLVRAAHDCSEGGLLVAAAEMAFAGGVGMVLDPAGVPVAGDVDLASRCFAETPGRYLLEIAPGDLERVEAILGDLPWAAVGTLNDSDRLTLAGTDLDERLDDLEQCWLSREL
ncbi:MAG: phosphoribosylformylglycinamidine synthase subunit PurL [Planctomycetota bacterium]|jgi:phosphoribosylformylglycinamidine synthase